MEFLSRFSLCLIAGLSILFLLAFPASPAKALEARPGHLLVGFDANASKPTIERILTQAEVESVRTLGQINTRLVRLKQGVTRSRAANSLRRSTAVEFIEPDYRVRTTGIEPQTLETQPVNSGRASNPNDRHYGLQWGLHNFGQSVQSIVGTVDADIDAPEAWDIETGLGGDVVVGIADTGIDLQHGDLVDNLWSNPDEIPGNGIDDDRNGRIDDVRGWNWVSNSANPDEDNFHGTHVAGTVAARGNNGKGVTGVSWGAKLAALKVLDSEGEGWTSDIASSALYAGREGMDVFNASLGGGRYSETFSDAIRVSPNTLFVFAAGNRGQDIDSTKYYPCSYDLPNVICVGSTNSRDDRSFFSNFGVREVDLAAPGESILSTYPQSDSGTDQYAFLTGTSMATPHVAGVAALLNGVAPYAPPEDVASWILDGGDLLGSLAGRTVTGRRLNAEGSLRLADANPDPPPIIDPGTPTVNPPSISFRGVQGATFECRLGNEPYETCTSPWSRTLAPGGYTLYVRARYASGSLSRERSFSWQEVDPPRPYLSGPDDEGRVWFEGAGEDQELLCAWGDEPMGVCPDSVSTALWSNGRYPYRAKVVYGARSSEELRGDFVITDAPSPIADTPYLKLISTSQWTANPRVNLRVSWPPGTRYLLFGSDIYFNYSTASWENLRQGPAKATSTYVLRQSLIGRPWIHVAAFGLKNKLLWQDWVRVRFDNRPPTNFGGALTQLRGQAFRLEYFADDYDSGIKRGQLSYQRQPGAGKIRGFKTRRSEEMRVRGKRPKWVRLFDHAGNRSRWARVECCY